jgi:hypothetical protein
MKFWDTGEETNTTTFDYDVMKKKFIENLDYLKEMSVEEQTPVSYTHLRAHETN